MLNDIIIQALKDLENGMIDEVIESLADTDNWTCEFQLMESRPAPETKHLAPEYRLQRKEREIARRSERRNVRAAKRDLFS